METCSLAFMLGKQCFAVSCYNDALCLTKPAFSPFYKPKIAFVKHTKEVVTGKWETCLPYSTVAQRSLIISIETVSVTFYIELMHGSILAVTIPPGGNPQGKGGPSGPGVGNFSSAIVLGVGGEAS